MTELVQIYFDADSLSRCFDSGVTKYYNQTLTPYFENDVIAKYPLTHEYTGFISHDFRSDIMMRRGEQTSPDLIKRVVEAERPDVLVMHGQKGGRVPIWQADNWHLKQFSAPWEKIMNHLGVEVPKEGWMRWRSRYHCIQNYWVMRSDLVEDYRKTLLIPAMEMMEGMKELWTDTGYKSGDRWIKHFGVPFIPLHPFICERLILVYIQKLKVSVL